MNALVFAALIALSASRLAVIREAPAFDLTAADGGRVTAADFRGHVTLVSFIFTTCSGSCPVTTHRMAQVQERLPKSDRIRLLSITLDPKRDTPEVLARYARQYDADPARWRFLTGPQETVAKVIAAWGMWAREAPNGQLDHPSRVFLVDAHGRMREIYNLDYLKPAWVIEDIQELLREK